jgi:hypothetical protein
MTLLVLCMLAVWRITYMLQDENGPFGVFARLQAWVAKHPDKPGSLSDGFFCFYCLSIWVAIPFAVVSAKNAIGFIIGWFAISAGAIFLQKLHDKL